MYCIVNEICPPRKLRIRENNLKQETDLTSKIKRSQNRARQKKSKSYKYLSKLLKKLINKNKKLVIERTVNDLDNNDGRWWNRLSRLLGKETTTPDISQIDRVWYDNKELSKHLNYHFVDDGQEFDEFHMPNIDQQCHQNFSVSIAILHLNLWTAI